MSRGHRLAVHAILAAFAVFFLLPLYVMTVTSFKGMDEIRAGSLVAPPLLPTVAPWAKAWATACTGVECGGLRGFFFNSVLMVIPAVLLSTTLGAFNGYVLSKWRFRGSDWILGLFLFGIFMPLQVVLLPFSQVLGWLGLASSVAGLVLVHTTCGIATTTLFFRNYFVGFPDEVIKAAKLDGAGFFPIFFRILLPSSLPIVMVTLIWQFTNIWNDFLFGIAFTGGGSKPVTVGLNNLANTSSAVKEYNVDMAAALIAGLPTMIVYVLAGKYFVRGLTAGAVKG